MKTAAVILMLCVLSYGQQSKMLPGLSLAGLNNDNCTFAVGSINAATSNTIRVGNGLASKWPTPPKPLDTFVMIRSEAMLGAPLDIFMAKYQGVKEQRRAKVKLRVAQSDFAYVLELRGCVLSPDTVKFIDYDTSK